MRDVIGHRHVIRCPHRASVAHQQAPLPEITAPGVASRILMSVQSEQVLAYRRSRRTISSNVVRLRPGHLPEAGDPGLGVEHAPAVPGLVLLDLVRQRRARPDQRHVASEHVPELRQLVEARLAQEAAERRHARIVGELEQRLAPAGLSLPLRLDELRDELADEARGRRSRASCGTSAS